MMEKKRFLDFLDMFDGGGAGQMGDKFEDFAVFINVCPNFSANSVDFSKSVNGFAIVK